MNSRLIPALTAACLALGCVGTTFAAKADLLPPDRRELTVNAAEKLTQRPAPAAVSPEMPSPFNPVGFDQPDPSAAPDPNAPRPGPAPAAGTPAPVQPPKPAGDREILESLAMRLTPSGMMTAPGGKALLIIDRNRFQVGTKFIVTFNDQDYELELVAIDRTTFTLRYRGEELTRPIKPVSK